MTDYIEATVTTNLDPRFLGTPQRFRAKFPCLPQVGNRFTWDERSLRILDIRWEVNPKTQIAELFVEINK